MRPRFFPAPGSRKRIEILQWRGDREYLVRLSTARDLWVNVRLHWLAAEQKSIPCCISGELDNSCPYCPAPSRAVTYIPCFAWDRQTNRWKQAIFTCNESMLPMLDEDLEICTFRTRRKGKANSPVTWSVDRRDAIGVAVPRFDILESLHAAWGCQESLEESQARNAYGQPIRVAHDVDA